MPVRLGVPRYVTGLVDVVSIRFTRPVGLLLFGQHNRASGCGVPRRRGIRTVWGNV